MTHNLDATVFVYRNHKDKKIKAEYFEKARLLEDSPDWDHIATLEPRIWIEFNYDTIEKTEQEPVAWLWEPTGEVTTDPDRADGMWLPLYTSPPQRTWVGLTDKERETATGWSVEHIEDFLKQKNGYAEEKN